MFKCYKNKEECSVEQIVCQSNDLGEIGQKGVPYASTKHSPAWRRHATPGNPSHATLQLLVSSSLPSPPPAEVLPGQARAAWRRRGSQMVATVRGWGGAPDLYGGRGAWRQQPKGEAVATWPDLGHCGLGLRMRLLLRVTGCSVRNTWEPGQWPRAWRRATSSRR